MLKLFPLIVVFALASCFREKSSERYTREASVVVNGSSRSGELAVLCRSLRSDSLIADEEVLARISTFLKRGAAVNESEYEGGDCDGRFKAIVLQSSKLILDKYDCGDYGFGNAQFITKGDSLRYVRKFQVEWSPDNQGNQFFITETIWESLYPIVIKKTRAKLANSWSDYSILDEAFEEGLVSDPEELDNLERDLADLTSKQN